MSSKQILKLGWISRSAAAFAVERWHYSRTMPMSKGIAIGVWESDTFVGAICFGMGASKDLGTRYGLDSFQVSELTRIALRNHAVPVSRIVSIALKMLKKQSPGIRLVVSFADTLQGHHGGIYQAGGWIYTGVTGKAASWLVDGKLKHNRAFGKQYGGKAIPVPKDAVRIYLPGKHRYLMPMDNEMKAAIINLSKPYPRKCAPEAKQALRQSIQTEEGSSTLTPALQ